MTYLSKLENAWYEPIARFFINSTELQAYFLNFFSCMIVKCIVPGLLVMVVYNLQKAPNVEMCLKFTLVSFITCERSFEKETHFLRDVLELFIKVNSSILKEDDNEYNTFMTYFGCRDSDEPIPKPLVVLLPSRGVDNFSLHIVDIGVMITLLSRYITNGPG